MTGKPAFMEMELKSQDPELTKLIEVEDMRQDNKIILIASESLTSKAVREALSTSFTNMYAEGYPSTRMSVWEKKQLEDHARHLSFYRRYADNRYYKGVDIIDIMESVAQKRCAEIFANENAPMEEIFVNVQALSGAAANNAVYNAFLEPGDTVMGMDLTSGGHLTHGSPVNRSGKNYNIIPYSVDKEGHIDYDDIRTKAMEHRPKIIISGFSAYPWSVDWDFLKEIAHSSGALLLADVSHVAGLIVAGEYPNPIGIADVTTFTTHKTLFGPRGACIVTTNRDFADKINVGVFPGEQGGPHENNIAAKAVAFEIAKSEEFKNVQRQITINARALSEGFRKRGIGVAYGGTDGHFLLVDLKTLKSSSGGMLNGEIVSRILEICGIVCNKNTIVGDDKAAFPSGIRLGTPIITQRGLKEGDMDELADIITDALKGMEAFSYVSKTGEPLGRTKMDYAVLERVKDRVHKLTEKMGRSTGSLWDYPYFYSEQEMSTNPFFRIRGERSDLALNEILGIDVVNMVSGDRQSAFVSFDGESISGDLTLSKESCDSFLLNVTGGDPKRIITWMRALSDGYLKFDPDITRKIDGPFVIEECADGEFAEEVNKEKPGNVIENSTQKADSTISFDGSTEILAAFKEYPDRFNLEKPYFIGQKTIEVGLKQEMKLDLKGLETYAWEEIEGEPKKSCLYEEHLKLNGTMVPFAGWLMPVKYPTSIAEEHEFVRKKAGLFDVSHMGVFAFRGEGAARFLDTITSNFVIRLLPGEAQYSYLLDQNGIPIDDIYLYMVDHNDYMMVVNAANIDKDKAWIQGLLDQRYSMDCHRMHVKVEKQPEFLDLKDPSCGAGMRVDIAFQGPNTRKIMAPLLPNDADRQTLMTLKGSELFSTSIAGINVIIARTGYTGEEFGFELFVHPDEASKLWNTLLDEGKELGAMPIGLGARDSTRVEAGFPLYGHELAGPYSMTPHGAGYGYFVKFHKPFFAGRDPLLEIEKTRDLGIARIKVEKGAPHLNFGDFVVNKMGKCIGYITSSALVRNQQIALAYVKKATITKVGTNIGLIPAGKASKLNKANLDEIKIGSTIMPAIKGEVISRFFNKSKEWS